MAVRAFITEAAARHLVTTKVPSFSLVDFVGAEFSRRVLRPFDTRLTPKIRPATSQVGNIDPLLPCRLHSRGSFFCGFMSLIPKTRYIVCNETPQKVVFCDIRGISSLPAARDSFGTFQKNRFSKIHRSS
jgi:hypothetical protein